MVPMCLREEHSSLSMDEVEEPSPKRRRSESASMPQDTVVSTGEETDAEPGYMGKGKKRAVEDEEQMMEKKRLITALTKQYGNEQSDTRDTTDDMEEAGANNEKIEQENTPQGNPETSANGKAGTRPSRQFGMAGPEAGIVLKIVVNDFMCHRKLSISLGRHVNFINGSNGSGKSAILAALQICLGAKASLTHRAKKLSDFIRHGSTRDAVLEVTLLNNEGGFEFHTYGKSITIRRVIKQPSGGSFALLDEHGQVVSRDKQELEKMLDCLNVQVDNPCAVLDQENSKKFLQGSEGDKYNFFMRATDLDKILKDSRQTLREIDKMKLGSREAAKKVEKLQQIMLSLRAELKEYDSITELENKIVHMKESIAWVHVMQEEDKVKDLEAKLKQKVVNVDNFRGREQGIADEIAQRSEETKKMKEDITSKAADVKKLKEVSEQARTRFQQSRVPLVQLSGQRAGLDKELKARKGEKRQAEICLKRAVEAAMRDASGIEERKVLEKIDATNRELETIAKVIGESEKNDSLDELQSAASRAATESDEAKVALQGHMSELTNQQSYVSSLRDNRSDPAAAFGRFMPALVRKINANQQRFQSLPIGPVGMYVKLKEEYAKFGVCVEAVIGRNLSSFVVACQQDKNELMLIMRSMTMDFRPAVILQHTTSRHDAFQAPPGFPTVMQAINVSHDQVFNSLVDQLGIEREGLFESKEHAEQACLIGKSGQYEKMPHTLRNAYYLSGRNNCSRLSVMRGNVETNTHMFTGRGRTLGVDRSMQLASAEEQLQSRTVLVNELKQRASQAKATSDRCQQDFYKARRRQIALERDQTNLIKTKEELNRQLDRVQLNKQENDPVQELERAIEEKTEEISNLEQDVVTLDDKIRELKDELKPLEMDAKEARAAHHERSQAATDATLLFDQKSVELEKQRSMQYRLQAHIAKAEEEASDLQHQKKAAEDNCQQVTNQAEQFMQYMCRQNRKEDWDGKRLYPKRSMDVLTARLESLKNKVDQERAKRQVNYKSKAEVQEKLRNAVNAHNEKEKAANKLNHNIDLLHAETRARTKKWMKLRDHIAQRTSQLFNQYLQRKGAAGEVDFHHEKGCLGLTYQKDNADDSSQCTDVKLLSGGERSFATLALLLALGASHECPFRVMDEFDVFMDALSRNIAIKEVIHFASQHSDKQFIFITPQDLSTVTPTEAIRIHKMRPPRKDDYNQATLTESWAQSL